MNWEKAKFFLIVAAVALAVIFLANNVAILGRAVAPIQRRAA